MQSIFSDGALSLHTRSLKYGKVSHTASQSGLSGKYHSSFCLWLIVSSQPIIILPLTLIFSLSGHQLGQGVLVQLSPSLIKRQKTHFHNLPCGASIILGNNGFVWLYPTPTQQEEEAGGFYTSLEVGAITNKQHYSIVVMKSCWQKNLFWGGQKKNIQISILRDFIDAILLLYHFVIVIAFSCACVEPISSSSFTFQPVTLSDREVISRLRNCLLALAAHKVLLYDTSVLYCYESSVQHQVGDISDRKRMWMYFFFFIMHSVPHKWKEMVEIFWVYCAICWSYEKPYYDLSMMVKKKKRQQF